MLAQPDEDNEEDDGEDDEEDDNEDDEDGGQEEVIEGVDPNPNAKDENKDKDTTTVTDEKTAAVAPAAAASTPVKLVTPAPKAVEDPKKDAKKDDKPADKKNVQTGDVSYEEIPAFHADAAFGGDYKREVPKQYTEMRDDRLMNSLISKYAREVKKDGKLTGQMFLNKEDA